MWIILTLTVGVIAILIIASCLLHIILQTYRLRKAKEKYFGKCKHSSRRRFNRAFWQAYKPDDN